MAVDIDFFKTLWKRWAQMCFFFCSLLHYRCWWHIIKLVHKNVSFKTWNLCVFSPAAWKIAMGRSLWVRGLRFLCFLGFLTIFSHMQMLNDRWRYPWSSFMRSRFYGLRNFFSSYECISNNRKKKFHSSTQLSTRLNNDWRALEV